MRQTCLSTLLVLLAACTTGGTAPEPSATAPPPPPADWPSGRGDNAGDGHPPGALLDAAEAAHLQLAWSVEVGSAIVAGPAVAGGVVVVGTVDGTLAAYSTEQGAPAWKVTGLGALTSPPTIFEGKVFVGSSAGHLYAFEMERGERIWDWRPPGRSPALWGGPVAHRGLIVVGVGGQEGGFPLEAGRLVALDPASGNPVWETCLRTGCAAGDPIRGGLAVDPGGHGFAATGQPDDALVAFDAGIGRIGWRRPLYGDGGRGLDLVATPLLLRDRAGRELVAGGGLEGTFAVLDARTGAPLWSRRLVAGSAGHGLTGSPAFDGHAIYVPSASPPNGLFALSPLDGRPRWMAATAEAVHSSPAAGAGVVVVGTGSAYGSDPAGGLSAFETAGGRRLWTYTGGAPVVAGPAIAGHAVYAGDRLGRLLAFKP
ncbi:MAG: hypothetical protein NVS9B1_16770 [Candidatus Dormibacteraceae bacterium]